MPSPLCVATVFYNPNRFESRPRLFHQFKKYMHDSGVKLFVVEIALHGREFEVTSKDNPWHLQLSTTQELWHKERALNLAFQHIIQLCPECEHLAWIDADVRFSHPGWAEETISLLHHYKVIQLFSYAQNLDSKHQMMWECPGIMKNFHDLGYHQHPPIPLEYLKHGHPGLAWAARREVLEATGGLIDVCIAGSGDTHMAYGMMGSAQLGVYNGEVSAGFTTALNQWAARAQQAINKNLGFLNSICTHYWHGPSEKRGYDRRRDIMQFHKYDPFQDIYPGLNGLWKFSGNKPHLALDLRRSAQERNEDSTETPSYHTK